MKCLKVLLLLLSSVLVLCSCGPNKPDNKVHAVTTEHAGFLPAGAGKAPIQKIDTLVQIAPTWGQAVYYADHRGDRPVTAALAFVFFLCLLALAVGLGTDSKYLPQAIAKPWLLPVFLVLFLLCWRGHAAGVKWNNDKWVPKQQYDRAIEETLSTAPIWDSLENRCLIIDGPYKCQK